jgi:hypothetical protein
MGAPKAVAMFFGGDKQRIFQALQSGALRQFAPAPFDQTLALAAAGYSDEQRAAAAAAQAKQGSQQTVFEKTFAPPQVMGGLPPQAPPQAPPPPSGGLGATPQAGPPMAPQGGPPQGQGEMIEVPMPSDMQPEGMAAGGMVPPYASGGGLSDVPIPDTMFDENRNGGFNDGYAGGGLVAFARGGYNDFHDAIIAKESGGRYGVANTEGSGAMGLGQIMPDTARALAKRLGLAYRPELLAGDDEESRKYQDALTGEATKEAWEYGKGDPQLAAQYYFAGPDKKGWGPKTQAYGSDIMSRLGGEATPMPREADTSTAQGRGMSFEDAQAAGRNLISGLPREEVERAKKYALEQLDEEAQKKEAKMDMWEGLASMGFRLASSNSPNILQAIGEAATATLPELKVSKKERKAAKDDAVKTLMALEDVDRKTAIAGVEVGMDIYKTGITADQAKRALEFQEKELTTRIEEARLNRITQKEIAMLKPSNPSDLEVMMAIMQQGTPEQKKALKEVIAMKRPPADNSGILGTGSGDDDSVSFLNL